MSIHLMRPLDRTTYPVGAEIYAPEILAAWLRAFPDAQPAQRDKEDWVENACFIEAFEKLNVAYRILEPTSRRLISAATDGIAQGEGDAAFFHSGIGSADRTESIGFSLILQQQPNIDAITGYAGDEIFLERAGRKMLMVKPDGTAMSEAIRTIAPENGQVFIKTIRKETAGIFAIAAERDAWQQICEQDDGLMWSVVQYEGNEAPFFCVQEVISPTYEYRMFMVGDRPVTGAGCIEAYTPLDNKRVFDVQMEEQRNRSAIEERSEIVDQYVAFATEFGAAFAERHGRNIAYSLDLCIDAKTGKVVPIELNPPFNLGRYASRVDVWVKAIDTLMKECA